MRRWIGAAAGIAVVLSASVAVAADVGAQINARQEYMKGFGKHMKGLFDGLKADPPVVADLQANAAALDAAAAKLPTYFPPGTGMDSGLKTGAKAEIWLNPADFKQHADAFAAAAHKLNLAAASGDIGATKAALGGVGGNCKSCHEAFRQEEH